MADDHVQDWQTVRYIDGERYEYVGGTLIEVSEQGWLCDVMIEHNGVLHTQRVLVTPGDIEAHRD